MHFETPSEVSWIYSTRSKFLRDMSWSLKTCISRPSVVLRHHTWCDQRSIRNKPAEISPKCSLEKQELYDVEKWVLSQMGNLVVGIACSIWVHTRVSFKKQTTIQQIREPSDLLDGCLFFFVFTLSGPLPISWHLALPVQPSPEADFLVTSWNFCRALFPNWPLLSWFKEFPFLCDPCKSSSLLFPPAHLPSFLPLVDRVAWKLVLFSFLVCLVLWELLSFPCHILPSSTSLNVFAPLGGGKHDFCGYVSCLPVFLSFLPELILSLRSDYWVYTEVCF